MSIKRRRRLSNNSRWTEEERNNLWRLRQQNLGISWEEFNDVSRLSILFLFLWTFLLTVQALLSSSYQGGSHEGLFGELTGLHLWLWWLTYSS